MSELESRRIPVGTSTQSGALDAKGEHCSSEREERKQPALSFPELMHQLVEDPKLQEVIRWSPNGNQIGIHPKRFSEQILSKRWHQATKFESFARRLNRWGFQRVWNRHFPVEFFAFEHGLFKKGKSHLVAQINTNDTKHIDYNSHGVRGRQSHAIREEIGKVRHVVKGQVSVPGTTPPLQDVRAKASALATNTFLIEQALSRLQRREACSGLQQLTTSLYPSRVTGDASLPLDAFLRAPSSFQTTTPVDIVALEHKMLTSELQRRQLDYVFALERVQQAQRNLSRQVPFSARTSFLQRTNLSADNLSGIQRCAPLLTIRTGAQSSVPLRFRAASPVRAPGPSVSSGDKRSREDSGEEESLRRSPHQRNLSRFQEERWEIQFRELKEYREKNGNCLVPQHNFPENPPLARWVKRQRYQYKLMKEGKQSNMTRERVEALESIGFVWDSHSAVWEERMKELEEFRSIHSHCNVPSTCPENQKLGAWVSTSVRCDPVMQAYV